MSDSRLVYSSSPGRRSQPRIEVDLGGIPIRLEPEASCIYVGDVKLDVLYVDDTEAGEDYAARFKIDCSSGTPENGHDLTYEVLIYEAHVEVAISSMTYAGDEMPDYWGDVREFTSRMAFFRFLRDEVLPRYRETHA